MTESKTPLRFCGQLYYGAEKIGFTKDETFVVEVLTTPPPKPCGSLFTTIPISPRSYRETHKTKASACRDGSEIVVTDDSGKPHRISGDDELLTALEAELRAHGLWSNTKLRNAASEPSSPDTSRE